MSARRSLALASAVAVVGLLFPACVAPVAQPFVPSEAGVITSRHSTPTDTTVVLAGGQQLTFRAGGVRWLNGLGGEGDLLLAGTAPARWAATVGGSIEGPGGLKRCFSVPGRAWDRGDYVEIDFGTGDGPVTLTVTKSPAWTSSGTADSGLQMGTYTCLDETGRAVISGWTGV